MFLVLFARSSQAPDDVPYHPDHPDLQDWDNPPTAVLWDPFRGAVRRLREGGASAHRTREKAGLGEGLRVDEAVVRRWEGRFGGLKAGSVGRKSGERRVKGEGKGRDTERDGHSDGSDEQEDPVNGAVDDVRAKEVDWCVVDGFLLYWDQVSGSGSPLLLIVLAHPSTQWFHIRKGNRQPNSVTAVRVRISLVTRTARDRLYLNDMLIERSK